MLTCFKSLEEQYAAWTIINAMMPVVGREETLQIQHLLGRHKVDHILTPGLTAAIYCGGVRPKIMDTAGHNPSSSSFLLAHQCWSLWHFNSDDVQTVVWGRIRMIADEQFRYHMFGPDPAKPYCLIADGENLNQDALEELFSCRVRPASFAELIAR